ncbi:MAG: T9SS type A sorting domain-containing protein [Candidatus Onthomorpha sp.]|nr:T9SS type A sorting domain-containing protein [Candidatus Onthomorpha sp.]
MKKLLLMATALLFACTADLFAQKGELSWEGDGSPSNPYKVSSADHFRAINTMGLDKYYKQTADIVIEDTIKATVSQDSITNAYFVRNFTGNYDGNGKSITFHMNVNIWNTYTYQGTGNNPKVFVGLFDTLSGDGVIKNLKITNSSISLNKGTNQGIVPGKLDWHAGLLCGQMDGANARIANCMITNSWIDAHDLAAKMVGKSFMHVGGVVGYMINGTLHEVAFINTNTDTNPNTPTPEYSLDGLACVGGIVAKIDQRNGNGTVAIEDCLFRGSLRVQRSEDEGFGVATVGGIVGRVHQTSKSSRISNCYVDASKIVSTNSAPNEAAAAGIAVSAINFDVYHCYADVGRISVDSGTGNWYPITGTTQETIPSVTKCEYSGATVKVGEETKYYSVGYKAQSPTNAQTTTQEPDVLWYLGDAFIQVCEPVCKIQLKSTIKGYIYSDKDGDFNNPATWQNYPDSWGNGIALDPNNCDWNTVLGIEIKHKVTLGNDFSGQIGAEATGETPERKVPIKIIDNNGRAALIVEKEGVFANATIKVEEGGSFVNTTNSDVQGVIEKRLHGGIWNFIGLSGYENLAPLRNRLLREKQSQNTGNTQNDSLKFWALGYDYQNSRWNEDNYLYWEDTIAPGAGILVYTNGDNILVEIGQNRDNQGNETGLNNFENDQTVSHTFQNSGPWVALANPYPAVMDARKAVDRISFSETVQGDGIYVREAKSYTWTFVADMNSKNKQINAAQGFFVKFSDEQKKDRTITLSKDMLVDYPQQSSESQSKSVSGAGEFLRVSVASEGYRVPVMYRQNDAASAEYDIFDADKLFGSGTVAEPYFALGERMLCKQEADSTHFVADLNIRSEQSRSVEIIAEYIPEGYTLSLIDDNNETEMNQDDVYTADIARGDNEGRFKLVINKNNVSIEDVANVEEINFYNNNRQITISGGNVKLVQVYNTLGQKVYETKQRTFTLDEVASGTYIVNVQTDETSFSNKIVVH